MESKGNKKKKSFGLVRWILIIICAIVICGSGAYLLSYVKEMQGAENAFDQLRERPRDLSALYAQNNDLIGWIEVNGTRIDYPVMQTPDDPEFYLHRDFEGNYSASGTPFLDANSVVFPRTSADGYAINVTWNWLIYGHNMNFGTMFHDLQEYDSVEFWQEHPTFTFDVYNPSTGVTDNAEYEIFAVSRSKIQTSDSDAFAYYLYAGYTDEETFNEYIAGVKAESSYDTGIVPQFGDQLVTLSTCAYHVDEGRFYICGRRIK